MGEDYEDVKGLKSNSIYCELKMRVQPEQLFHILELRSTSISAQMCLSVHASVWPGLSCSCQVGWRNHTFCILPNNTQLTGNYSATRPHTSVAYPELTVSVLSILNICWHCAQELHLVLGTAW